MQKYLNVKVQKELITKDLAMIYAFLAQIFNNLAKKLQQFSDGFAHYRYFTLDIVFVNINGIRLFI